MRTSDRRSWLKQLSTIGAGSLLISPKDILASHPESIDYQQDRDVIRLTSNENPYSPSPAMQDALANMGKQICRYPNNQFPVLEAAIAAKEGIDPAHVVVTSGSREGLKAVGLMKAMQGGEISCCLPTYKALLTYAELWGSELRVSPLNDKLEYNLPAIEAGINDKTQMAFVCNPNNPTGTLVDSKSLESFCRRVSAKTTVFVDEVYFDYIEEPNYPSMKHLVTENLDVIISRTYSKVYGLAGARIGYLMAGKETAAKIRASLMSGTSVIGITLGQVAVKDDAFKAYSLKKNQQCKQIIYKALDDAGLEYLRSHANFVFFKTGKDIAEVQQDFLKQGVEVGRAFPPYTDWCRVSTGLVEEVEQFAAAVKAIYG